MNTTKPYYNTIIKYQITKNTLLTFSIAFIYFYTGELSLDLLSGHNIVNLGVFAPEGLALAFALFYGKRVWFGIFIGQFILAYTNDINIFSTLEISFINATEALIGIALFHKFKLNKRLETFRDVIGLILIIVFVLQIFSSVLSNLSLLLHDQLMQDQLAHSIFSWWVGNIMGQLLFTPFLLLLLIHYKQLNLKEYLLYGIIFTLFLYFLEIILAINNPFLLLSLTIPVLVLTISYKGKLYGTLISVVVATVSSYSVYLGTGAFYFGDKTDNIINYNLYVLAHIATVFIAGILFEERKKLEEILQESIEKEVNKNKKQQLLMLQQNRLAQMGEMINMIAHQWRQPLNHLSLINQTLYYQYTNNKLNDEKIEAFKKKSDITIQQMSSTIDDFRNFFNPEKSKTVFCVNDVITHVLSIVSPMLKHKSIKVIFKNEKHCDSYGFPNELGQSILNIMYNAQDALNEKKIADKYIEILLFCNADTIILSIHDNAGGIPEEIINQIFDPYFSTKSKKNGTGLGLYMSKIIIEDHMNGKILVSNKKNGACFKIYLSSVKTSKR
jgi:signal transduction histidine kinase